MGKDSAKFQWENFWAEKAIIAKITSIATLVKGEKLTPAVSHVAARVLQTTTAVLFLATYVVYETGSLGVMSVSQGCFQCSWRIYKMKKINFQESSLKKGKECGFLLLNY